MMSTFIPLFRARYNFKPGDVLFYRLDVWYRGTPVFAGKVRYVHNLVWKRRDARSIYMWNQGLKKCIMVG